MAVAQPPERLAELEHSEEILLQELQRVDEILLQELQNVDEMLLRIAAAIEQLPERVASANGTRAAEPARNPASTRPFDPYGEDEVEVQVSEDSEAAAKEVAAFAVMAGGVAVLGLIVSVLL
jgi:hypothetical protein